MRVPYIVGRWVRGHDHYGRLRLIQHLTHAADTAIWVIGTRRMGKTSLLRQLEHVTTSQPSHLVPLFWDLQGCQTCDELSTELYFALEEVQDRFGALGVDVGAMETEDATVILRRVTRVLSQQGKQLFLLIDEAEALIEIGRQDPNWLARLRKSLQTGQLRTVMTSTKLLSQLHDLSANWVTSPFLFGFSLANLWMLDHDAAVALVCQSQAAETVQVDDHLLEEILLHTNAQPYLIQFLCQRLFRVDEAGRGYLRPIQDGDLIADQIVSGFFEIDFRHLARIERRILLAVSELTVASNDDMLALLSDESPARISTFLYGLHRLGYLRLIGDRWTVGNEFLCRWVRENYDELSQDVESPVNEQNLEALLNAGKHLEHRFLAEEQADIPDDLLQARRKSLPDDEDEEPS